MMTLPQSLNDPKILWYLAAVCTALFIVWGLREIIELMVHDPKRQRLNVEAQRLMLAFCKDPTRERYENAWDFIMENEVMLCELDWPLVQRFTRMRAMVEFPIE